MFLSERAFLNNDLKESIFISKIRKTMENDHAEKYVHKTCLHKRYLHNPFIICLF